MTTEAKTNPKVIAMPNPKLARRLLYLALVLFLLGLGIGIAWDGAWHARNPFENFFSPPHIFIYVMSTLTALVVMAMVFIDPVRVAFGRGFNVVILPFKVPGALFLLGAGIVILGFAGLILDNIWHSTFGLDETRWSFPHSMLGMATLLTAFGFAACRLALRTYYPLRWHSKLLVGVLLVWPLASPLGPLVGNHTPFTVQAVAQIPALAVQEPFQHTFRIYEAHNLNRTHWLLIPFGGLWASAALAIIQRLDRRWWMILLMAFLGAVASGSRSTAEALDRIMPLMNNPANWQPLPLFWAAGVLAILNALRAPTDWAYGFAGAFFAVMVINIWGPHTLGFALILLAVPIALVGRRIGDRIYDVIEHPEYRDDTLAVVLIAGVAIPFVTGIIDLILRVTTP